MKLSVIGSRSFNNYELLKKIIIEKYPTVKVIVSGGARGADQLAEKFAVEMGLKKEIYLPDWNLHGKSAGFIRNRSIIENCDMVVAFWDGKSKGTKNSIDLAKRILKPVLIVEF